MPGDIVHLSAGDMVPADVRLLSAKDVFVSQSALTGESLPVEKLDQEPAGSPAAANALARVTLCFMGTNLVSGTATALVLLTGARTQFGSLAKSVVNQRALTSFDKGVNRVTLGADPVHVGHGPGRLPAERVRQGRLERGLPLCDRRRRGSHAGNAADGRHGQPGAWRGRHVAPQGDRQAVERDSEPRRDGRPLHRQDRHADAGQGRAREAPRI